MHSVGVDGMQIPNCAQYMQTNEDTVFHHIHVQKNKEKVAFMVHVYVVCDIQAVVIDQPSQRR